MVSSSALDLALKNQFSNLTYTFQETQSVQTLLAFVPSRFGFIGVFFGLYLLFKQFKERKLSGNIYVPYVICLVLSFFYIFKCFSNFISYSFSWARCYIMLESENNKESSKLLTTCLAAPFVPLQSCLAVSSHISHYKIIDS